MTDETQVPQPDPAAPPVVPETPPPLEPPPQPDAVAAPVVAAPAKPEEDAARSIVNAALNEPVVETAALDAVAGVEHAHSMVSTWLQRVEAGLHVPLDELRALKARLEKWL